MIKTLADLDSGVYKQAFMDANPEGGRAYVNFDAYLLKQAETGNITPELVTADLEEQQSRYGRELSPTRQMLHNSGITFLGKRSSAMDVFFRESPSFVKGADVLLPALMQGWFEAGVEGSGLMMDVAQGGLVSRGSSPTDLLYRQIVQGGLMDRQLDPTEYANLVRLDELVSMNTGINSDSYRGMVIESENLEHYEFGRVAEAGEIPLYVLTAADREVRVYKRGGGVKATYEVLRRQSLNQVARVFMLFGLARRLQLIRDALTVAVNGDGNPNSGALNTPVANAPTIQTWDEYAIDNAAAHLFGFTHVAGDATEVKRIRALRYAVTNLQMTPDQLAMYGGFRAPGGQVLRMVPANSILSGTRKTLWWNQAQGLEQVTENGSLVREAEKFILTQEQVYTMTYNSGFAKGQPNAFHTATRNES